MAHVAKNKYDSGKGVAHDIHVEHGAEVRVPPGRVKSKFKKLEDWLLNICDNDKPKKSIDEFEVNFFQSSGQYTLFLIGVNTYEESKNHYATRIEFQPTNMFFKLPKSEYQNLNRQQLQDLITSKLKDFTNTETFKTSFLAKANVIRMGFNGEEVWSK